jgi:uncharacterized protein with PQ loop repeat
MLKQLIIQLYGVSGILMALFYLPQLRSVWTDMGGARSVSLLTWGAWTAASSVALLYALLVVQDVHMGLAAGTNAIGCALVLGVSAYRRARTRRQNR